MHVTAVCTNSGNHRCAAAVSEGEAVDFDEYAGSAEEMRRGSRVAENEAANAIVNVIAVVIDAIGAVNVIVITMIEIGIEIENAMESVIVVVEVPESSVAAGLGNRAAVGVFGEELPEAVVE